MFNTQWSGQYHHSHLNSWVNWETNKNSFSCSLENNHLKTLFLIFNLHFYANLFENKDALSEKYKTTLHLWFALPFTIKTIFSSHIIQNDTSKWEMQNFWNNDHTLQIPLCFLGPVNHLCLVSSLSCLCRHTAEKKVPKQAICCDPLTKILVVRDVGISWLHLSWESCKSHRSCLFCDAHF